MLGFIFNLIFFIIVVGLCVVRHKGYCGTCDGNKWGDIFQILVTGIAIIFLVGIYPIVKLAAIILVTCILRYSFINKFENKDKKNTNCNNCEDNFV
ncbi:MAG: hypothetical protein ACRCXX_13930 [Cetobacterium sp.]|uniref:hypothetical protein n=1 Tax=Cetobacterium sp. TaxID=2071632 RepID=UPI003F3EA781